MGQTVIPLYKKVPNSIPGPNNEKSETTDIIRISNVSVPTLTIFLAPKETASGAAVIICPGGGYSILAFDHEGTLIAKELNAAGVTAFVLKYRLPDSKIMPDKSIGPLQDAQQAIKLVRERAKEWNLDAGKIGIAGFSAGGHLAATASTQFGRPVIDNASKTSLRPDFSILVYPVISFTDSIGHQGSRNNLIGPNPAPEKVKLYSNELQVNKQTPPAFLVHAGDDEGVKVANSLRYYEALQKNGIPAELHIYPKGGHGFGLNNRTTPDRWMERCINWMKASGWVK